MSFSDDFASCLSPLPTPSGVLDDAEELIDFLERLHQSWENAGGDDEMLLSALLAASPAIPELAGVAAEVGEVTVLAYITACAGCAASAAGSAIWDAITASNDAYVKNALTVAANDAGIPADSAIA